MTTNFCEDVYHSIIRAGLRPSPKAFVSFHQRSSLSVMHREIQFTGSYQIFVDIHHNNIGFVRVVG